MVDRHGTDDIPIRVSHLETSVDRLHSDNQRTQHTLAGVVASLDSQGRILTDIASKLDDQRTKRPDMLMILTVAIMSVGLLGTIGGFALAPAYRELNASAAERKEFKEFIQASEYAHGRADADLDALKRDVQTLRGN